jgi:phosphopantothenate---cysteine ligase (CTP)
MPRCLVTAGPTREPIDDVRDWGNIFTGKSGFAIAKALAEVAEVDLLTSNAAHAREANAGNFPNPIHAECFSSHASLKDQLAVHMAALSYDAVFMVAAVSDYTPTRVYSIVSREPAPSGSADPSSPSRETWVVQDAQAGKVKSSHEEIAVLGKRTEKLVDLFRTKWNHRGLLVKFKLEVGISADELILIGHASRRASRADYLVANTLNMVDEFRGGAYLISDTGAELIPRTELAGRMRDLLRDYLKG